MDFLQAHWLDITTTVLGLAYIIFEYKASLWMWVVGFLMQALGIVLYYQKGLYADCGMEFYYLSMTVYGYWRWLSKSPKLGDNRGLNKPLTITHFPKKAIGYWILVTCVVWAVIYWLLVTFTNSNVPLADSFTTALSIVGIWALAHKYLEQWFIWIAVDIVTCVLYFYKDIPFKASLYALYVVIAIAGYFKWRRLMLTSARK
jgi:nicotinamide mononucleotide transporter